MHLLWDYNVSKIIYCISEENDYLKLISFVFVSRIFVSFMDVMPSYVFVNGGRGYCLACKETFGCTFY